jgi:hypothetical protein
MRRLLYSMTALSLLGLAMGCHMVGGGIGSDCGCGGDGPAPMTGPIPAPITNPARPMPATPEGIREMPRITTPTSKAAGEDSPARLTPEPDGVDLLK